MYLKFINKDADLPESWKDYFKGIGDELNIIAKEINGPSWGPEKNKIDNSLCYNEQFIIFNSGFTVRIESLPLTQILLQPDDKKL